MRSVLVPLLCLASLAWLVSCIDGLGDDFFGDTGSVSIGSDCFETGDTNLRFADFDHDGYGDADSALSACDAPSTWVDDDSDCNDGDATINPEAVEICGDDVDQDCDGEDTVCAE